MTPLTRAYLKYLDSMLSLLYKLRPKSLPVRQARARRIKKL